MERGAARRNGARERHISMSLPLRILNGKGVIMGNLKLLKEALFLVLELS